MERCLSNWLYGLKLALGVLALIGGVLFVLLIWEPVGWVFRIVDAHLATCYPYRGNDGTVPNWATAVWHKHTFLLWRYGTHHFERDGYRQFTFLNSGVWIWQRPV